MVLKQFAFDKYVTDRRMSQFRLDSAMATGRLSLFEETSVLGRFALCGRIGIAQIEFFTVLGIARPWPWVDREDPTQGETNWKKLVKG